MKIGKKELEVLLFVMAGYFFASATYDFFCVPRLCGDVGNLLRGIGVGGVQLYIALCHLRWRVEDSHKQTILKATLEKRGIPSESWRERISNFAQNAILTFFKGFYDLVLSINDPF